MVRNLKKYEFFGMIFCIILGVVLHFTYEWSGENYIVGMFSAVNESVWEHLKLVFFPIFIYTVFEYFLIGYNYDNFIISKAISVLIAMLFVVVSFYSYSGIIGSHFLWMDIAIFIIAIIIAFYLSSSFINHALFKGKNAAGLLIFFIVAGMFMVFTVNPPQIELFRDPVDNSYGIERG